MLPRKRVLGIYFLFFAAFLFLMGRLCWLQFFRGQEFTAAAVGQRVRTIAYQDYSRGQILDRNGESLTNDLPRPCAVAFPVMIRDFSGTAQSLSKILEMTRQQLEVRFGSRTRKGQWQVVKEPFILKANLSSDQAEAIQKLGLPGIYVIPLITRYRPDLPAVHLIGSVTGVDKKNQGEEMASGGRGISGLEKQYDRFLKYGLFRQAAVLVDDSGRAFSGKGVTLLSEKEVTPFSDLKEVILSKSKGVNLSDEKKSEIQYALELTIDGEYQKIAEEELGKKSGAVVIMDVMSGDILALASGPKFDPYQIGAAKQNDLLNKALISFHPASVFKILIAAAALEEGVVSPEELFQCTGQIKLSSGQTVSCWNREGHGVVSFAQGMADSCNPVFIETGLRLGGDKILEYAHRLGLDDNEIIGYKLSAEKNFNFNSNVPADIANASIGEKGVRLSPVTVAKLVSEIANGGLSVSPRLVQRVKNDKDRTVLSFPRALPVPVISPATAGVLRQMLIEAVDQGTGKTAKITGLTAGGKTGSSQTDGVWFAGFAPGDSPRWAVVVFLPEGQSGAGDAAPIFREVVRRLADSVKK